MINETEALDNENLEIEFFLEALFKKYGYDFRNYSRSHIKRRILDIKNREKLESVSVMTNLLLNDGGFKNRVLHDFSINYTEMFRDPDFYLFVKDEILDLLRTFPFIKIWHAGCSTGEEIYSLAIILREAGLYERVQIYATDFNDSVLKSAKEGVYPIDYIKDYTANYQKAGGTDSFSNYYISDDHHVMLDSSLKEKVVFANHNLVSDGVFGEMNMILCRNVLIYFNKELQNNVLRLFKNSLCHGGILCLGSKESIIYSAVADDFDAISEKFKIYKLKYGNNEQL